MTTRQTEPDALRDQVRARYAAAAAWVTGGQDGCGCGLPADCGCDSGCCGGAASADEPGFGAELYAALDRDQLPDTAVLASLGCGNPTAVAELGEGRSSWTWARAAASTCCPPGGSGRPARPTGWT